MTKEEKELVDSRLKCEKCFSFLKPKSSLYIFKTLREKKY